MGRLVKISARNFRSIGDWIDISMPDRGPLTLMGENNAGKSNILRTVELVLGEPWPGNFHPEEHDFHQRSRDSTPMEIVLTVADVWHTNTYGTCQIEQLSWRYDPSEQRVCAFDAISPQGQSFWASNATRQQVTCMVVGPDRRLDYQLSYSSKWTFLSRLMRKFHETLVDDPERVARLRAHFDDVVEVFHEVEEFRLFGSELRSMASDFAANLRYGLDFDFSAYDPSNYFRSLRVHPTQGGEIRTFEELGTGQEQILAVAFAYAYAQAYGEGGGGLVIVIEEPEAHLHPLAQQWLARKLDDLTDRGVQVIVTTHSPAFVNLSHISSLACVKKPDAVGRTTVVQHTPATLAQFCRGCGATSASEASIEAFYGASATEQQVAGLFSRACVVVEGPTEALALPVLLAASGHDPLERGIAIVAAGGVGSMARWIRLYRAYGIPVMAMFDLDSDDDRDGAKRRDLLATLGEEIDLGNGLAESEPLVVGHNYAMFVSDFEHSMRALFPGIYLAAEEQARLQLGPGKPLIARQACRVLARSLDHSGWTEVQKLASAVGELVKGPSRD